MTNKKEFIDFIESNGYIKSSSYISTWVNKYNIYVTIYVDVDGFSFKDNGYHEFSEACLDGNCITVTTQYCI